jgi:hypothetical protein
VIPISVSRFPSDSFQLVCKVPPGLDPCILRLHLRIDGHRASQDFCVALESPLNFHEAFPSLEHSSFTLHSAVDAGPGHLSIWIQEPSPLLSLNTLAVRLAGIDLSIDFLSPEQSDGIRQINCRLPRGLKLETAIVETHIEIWNEGQLVATGPLMLRDEASS